MCALRPTPSPAMPRHPTLRMAEAPETQLSFSPEEQRDLAWDANRRGNTLIMSLRMIQILTCFFLVGLQDGRMCFFAFDVF